MSSTRGRLAAAALFCLSAGPVLAQDYEAVVDLPKGSVIDMVIERTRVDTKGRETIGDGMTLVSRFKQRITPTEHGYRVAQTTVSQEARLKQDGRELVEPMVETRTPDLTFETDESLAPMAIADWKKVVDDMIAEVAKSMGEEANTPDGKLAIQFVRDTFGAMNAEQAASTLLQEQMMVSTPQNVLLDLDDPLSGETEVESPLGGGVIKGSVTIELVQLDKPAGRAVILMKESLDPASATALARRVINQLMERLPPDKPRPTEAEMAALKLERSTSCRYEMDLKSGLALKTDCTATTVSMDQSLEPNRRVDRWVITQALTLP